MGARLVSAAINPHWSQLSHLQHRVLVVMAQTALDAPSNGRPRAIYWAGWSYIALCIFGTDDPTRAQLESIRRALVALVQTGAVERAEAATGRRRTRYRLVLDQFSQPQLPEDEPALPVDNSQIAPTSHRGSSPPPGVDSPHLTQGLFPTTDRGYSENSPNKKQDIAPVKSGGGGTKEEERRDEDLTGGGIARLSAQPQVGADQPVDKPERCAECGRPERDCRARSAIHGGHDYRPVELAPLRLA